MPRRTGQNALDRRPLESTGEHQNAIFDGATRIERPVFAEMSMGPANGNATLFLQASGGPPHRVSPVEQQNALDR
jgi:hypothetical protein